MAQHNQVGTEDLHPNPSNGEDVDVAGASTSRMSSESLQDDAHVLQQQLMNDIAAMRTDFEKFRSELPILLANSQAGNRGPLHNPTVPGWVLLAAPNPVTRDELRMFTKAQCIKSADTLGLPSLPPHTVLLERKRQIGARIGVTI